ncbi:molybdate ABC transporter substrate-binding protein [Gorillibacterium massiliense]|uniref:molybdate ABC transporter substrate-binding protein n=1 Tax=Gorillibacterium massiliense TaxID=1280390 RepID=UPI0004AD2CE3|nr:molybdate ABC transporter substrate-binding protein [Gorillibacterium massiliense]
MKMGKRISCLLAALMLILVFALAGCGSKSEDKTASSTDPSPSVSAAATATAAASESPSPTPTAEPVELTISAAASLTESLNELKELYHTKAPQVTLTFNYGASGTLQQQIEQGAPADLFISAGAKQINALVDKQLIDKSQVTKLLLNDLVLVSSTDSKVAISKLEDLTNADIKKIAIGIPESVPAGSYAQESLTYFKLWDTLQPKIVQAKDVKQVLSYVETGNTEAGFVYKTDALTSKKAKVVLTVDPASHKQIVYPMGIIKATKHLEEAQAFYQFLQSQEALDVFVKNGFTAPSNAS